MLGQVGFKILRAILFLKKRIASNFWQWYNIHYCLANKVEFVDRKSIRFNDRSIISISPNADVFIGKSFYMNSGPNSGIGSTMSKIVVNGSAKLRIGNYTGISSTTILVNNSVIIGNHVNIGGGCFINDSNNHSTYWRDRENRRQDVKNAKTAPIVIGDYVFVGARSMILKGITIGEKSIIAAGSVVVKDIPANCIAGGNPCEVIKFLNDL